MSLTQRRTCHIQIKNGEKIRSEQVDTFPFVIGRGEECAIQILTAGISRAHLSVLLKEDTIWIEDLGSSNGTCLNGKKIKQKTPIPYSPGDFVQLGLVEVLTFEIKNGTKKNEISIELPPLPVTAEKPEKVENSIQLEKPKNAEKTGEAPEALSHALVEATKAANIEYVEGAKAMALRIKKSAEAESDQILERAQAEAAEIKNRAHVEFQEEDLRKREEVIKKAQAEAVEILRKAQKERERISAAVLETERKKQDHILEQEHKKLAEVLLTSQLALGELEKKRANLHEQIENLTSEHDKLKEKLDEGRSDLKKALLLEERTLREKLQKDVALQGQALEDEFKKTRVKELSGLLDSQISSALKENPNLENLPQIIYGVVERVLKGDSPRQKSKRFKKPLAIVGLCSLILSVSIVFRNVIPKIHREPTSVQAQRPAPVNLTTDYRDSYTHNILYNRDYLTIRMNPSNSRVWNAELARYLPDQLFVDNARTGRFIEIEGQMLQKLSELESKTTPEDKVAMTQQMEVLEKFYQNQFVGLLGSQKNYEVFRSFEKNYLDKIRATSSK